MRLTLLPLLLLLATPLRADPAIGIAFPPVSTAAHRAFTSAALVDLGIQHIRIAEAWSRRPLDPGPQDFAPLAERTADLRAAGLRILLTVELDAPDAACGLRNDHACIIRDDAPFEAYLTTLLQAVGDDLDAIQIGNEWDNRFPGSTRDFLALHARAAAVIRAERPDLTLVLGGVTGRAGLSHALCFEGDDHGIPGLRDEDVRQWLCNRGMMFNEAAQAAVSAALSIADYDVADIHLYDAPGLWPGAVAWMQAHTDRPVWVTEFGGPWPRNEPSDPDYHAARLAVYLDTIATLPVARAYYFKLTDDPGSYHAHSGLYDTDGQPKPALAIFTDWMAGR
ncbi:glycoside hydrolase family protein [Hasllibacter sp. MH4015]|uniref:glycoside hydrolase family protein n=1 Tax=Hasllibacter sp. MH4015 TaxID=2854029 RepID=UPI001CD43CAE|nr:glycoside hydrolase family protein [Hasllibacter sp. MH4015]